MQSAEEPPPVVVVASSVVGPPSRSSWVSLDDVSARGRLPPPRYGAPREGRRRGPRGRPGVPCTGPRPLARVPCLPLSWWTRRTTRPPDTEPRVAVHAFAERGVKGWGCVRRRVPER